MIQFSTCNEKSTYILVLCFIFKVFAVILEYLRTENWWFAGIPKRQVFDEARYFKIHKRVLVVTVEIEEDFSPGRRLKLG